mmetsp:Transcript_27385/g.40432  ORF Transcript_27385/g.40432 Transcript_27385/m.40432 type:complete len:1332 (+) Transcript_27385:149-4144(+)|eukprot:CAMPEP_0194209904 /NCGR_PEP_ID=MMETSP0156-20130528/7869_1 /TAXON_ID=33649 /ORGANISM="Thalassionema nitzschioides, Strain L26-B" /LENGTH=1331 /DNA_ID=CAMNT_0038937161 /DNA_START=97 /DNA_END=4092 /DNA_ORIENTATION=+
MGIEENVLVQEGNNVKQAEEEAEGKQLTLKNLKITPPVSSNLEPVILPPLRTDEPVASIRAALGELVGYAPITNYKLVANGKTLDDFGDLSGVSDNSEIEMKLEFYSNVREHVLRLLQLLQGNPPVVTALVGSSSDKKDEGDDKNGKNNDSVVSKKSKSKKTGKDQPDVKDDPIPAANDLNDFFEGATGLIDPNTETLTKLEDSMRLPTQISFLASPSARRQLLGDLCHLRVDVTDDETLFITAVRDGFYKNKSTASLLNPAPCSQPHLEHTLLDCLIKCSPKFAKSWNTALESAQERLALTSHDEPLQALYRVTRNNQSSSLDAVFIRPSWIVPPPIVGLKEEVAHPTPTLLQDTYGLDWTSGITRDWNEELQSAREMPVSNIHERLERARVIHKTLIDFGDSSYKAVRAIYEGQIQPMNPNEPIRSHVYLHNSIFVSRAVDSGVETFKMSLGDKAAKKAASRDAQCMAMLHRMDVSGLHTLATVLVDYLGTRYVCQSVVPGILQGDKTHTLVYGAVEASANLTSTKEMHELLEKYVGKHAMCATRVQPTQPLTDERLAVIAELRTEPPLVQDGDENSKVEATTLVCGPIEGKGIKGSDKRNYVLDLTRLTPRDANWISESNGGTGKYEEAYKACEFIPESLDDDEWFAFVLRHELVTQLTHQKMTEYLKSKEPEKKVEKDEKDEASNHKQSKDVDQDGDKKGDDDKGQNDSSEDVKKKTDDSVDKLQEKKTLTPEDEKYLESLRYNVNVFLPQLRSLKGIADSAVEQLELDEERARQAAVYLWDVVLPKLTQDVRQGDGNQLPIDGKSMIEFLHQRGVNCRYLGRIAFLASLEEVKDRAAISNVQSGKAKSVNRRVMPLSWLELLEVEMIARAAKHVLDSYLNEEGCNIVQVIASFLSALVTKGEETAGETEKRLSKGLSYSVDDEEELAGLALASSVPIRSRKEVWDDVQRQIGRRFRYKLTLYNGEKDSGRTSYATLLRRICQRTGVRLVAKNYALGGKSLCSSEGGLVNSYPISPSDISDVVPLIKHAGALAGEGFVPCVGGVSLPSLHILLPDAKATFEAAHFSYGARNLPQALDLAQEAAALYQRVVDGPIHLNIARCLDLTAAILFEAGEPALAAANASRSLGLTIQLGGFDCAEALTCHSTLSHILLAAQQSEEGIRHLKAASYLMELLAGPRYVELANCYYKIGNFYQEKNGAAALQYYKSAQTRPHSDRLAEGMMAKGSALLYAKLEQYRFAVDAEKKALQLYSMLLGENHELTLNSQKSLQHYTKLAVQQGNKQVEQEKLRKQEEEAAAIASQIEAEEEEEQQQQQQQKKKKNKGKKKK